MPLILCPRCGQLGYLEKVRRGNRDYYYVVHSRWGKKTKSCYIGPVEDYKYLQKIHGELGFTNILSQDYVVTIQVLIERVLEIAEQNNEKATEILQNLVKILEEGLAKARAALKKPQLEA